MSKKLSYDELNTHANRFVELFVHTKDDGHDFFPREFMTKDEKENYIWMENSLYNCVDEMPYYDCNIEDKYEMIFLSNLYFENSEFRHLCNDKSWEYIKN